jgi:hypothetical protein
MYAYILEQWVAERVTSDWVLSLVPRWITSEQATAVLATPQTGLFT